MWHKILHRLWPRSLKNDIFGISSEAGYVLCGVIHGPKGQRTIEQYLTGGELRRSLPEIGKLVGISPLEVLRQLSVDEAICLHCVVQEVK